MNNPAAILVAFWKRHYLTVMLLVVPVAVLFPVCGHDFVLLDDPTNVYENDLVKHFSWENLAFFWKAPYDFLYVPVTYTLWGILAKLSQFLHPGNPESLDPHLFHSASLLVHLLSTAVLFRILKSMLADEWGAAVGALLFAIHPVQVEAVAWVTGMKDLLSGFWSLLCLWLYLLCGRREKFDGTWWLLYLAATIFCLLALLAKPSAVILPLLAAVIGRFVLGESWRRLLRELLPWAVLVLPIISITQSVQDGSVQHFLPSYWQRLLVAGDAVSFYLFKIFLPISLAFDYGRSPQALFEGNWVYLTGLLPYVLLLLLGWKLRREWLWLGGGMFVIPLLPVLGLVPFNFQVVSTVTDRYLYLALLGPAFSVGWLYSRHHQQAVKVLTLVALALLGVRSSLLVAHWENSSALYHHALAVNPRSWLAYNNLGSMSLNQGQPEAAARYYQQSVDIVPKARAYLGLGMAFEQLGDPSGAIIAYRRAVELQPKFADVYDHLGSAYRSLGNNAEAIAYFKKAVAVDPDSPGTAVYYADLGMAFSESGNSDWAIHAYQKALVLNPALAGVNSALGNLYLSRNETAKAQEMYEKDLALDPGNSQPYNGLAMVYSLTGRKSEAVDLLRQAIKIAPDSGQLYNNLAVVYREMGQAELAKRYAEQARILEFDAKGQ